MDGFDREAAWDEEVSGSDLVEFLMDEGSDYGFVHFGQWGWAGAGFGGVGVGLGGCGVG